ncbi:MAG: hypothetical protein WCW53_02170 [Syntrophales bacterium]
MGKKPETSNWPVSGLSQKSNFWECYRKLPQSVQELIEIMWDIDPGKTILRHESEIPAEHRLSAYPKRAPLLYKLSQNISPCPFFQARRCNDRSPGRFSPHQYLLKHSCRFICRYTESLRWQSTDDLNRKGKSDSDQLAFAVQEERCFMTFNINTPSPQKPHHWRVEKQIGKESI